MGVDKIYSDVALEVACSYVLHTFSFFVLTVKHNTISNEQITINKNGQNSLLMIVVSTPL